MRYNTPDALAALAAVATDALRLDDLTPVPDENGITFGRGPAGVGVTINEDGTFTAYRVADIPATRESPPDVDIVDLATHADPVRAIMAALTAWLTEIGEEALRYHALADELAREDALLERAEESAP